MCLQQPACHRRLSDNSLIFEYFPIPPEPIRRKNLPANSEIVQSRVGEKVVELHRPLKEFAASLAGGTAQKTPSRRVEGAALIQ
jgi:hypothetical protein